MSIVYDEKARSFTLSTRNTAYQFVIGAYGYLLHTYYGARVDGQSFSYLLPHGEVASAPKQPVNDPSDPNFSTDIRPLEYACCGAGDFRHAAVVLRNADGSQVADLRYERHEISKGKYALDGLPAFFSADEGNADTLRVWLKDGVTGLSACLLYGVFFDTDVITRAVVFANAGGGDIVLNKAQSLSVDFMFERFDLIQFPGRWGMEREFERLPVTRGIHTLSSSRGSSSHQHNPGFILCETGANEHYGRCYGFNLVYSGSFRAHIERDQVEQTRVSVGAGDDGFGWLLKPGESFTTPEAVMSFSGSGFARLSNNLHLAVRRDLCVSPFSRAKRPALINNWEATYFNFNGEKLVEIAKEAVGLGVELFVLDDGWFGARSDDRRALGDWVPNEPKLGGTIGALAERINAEGLKFGLWFEPEMVNEDSDLYRAHPDWALKTPGRAALVSRNQLVLDLSRREVREYIFDVVSGVLDSANIEYVKWDMNRSIADRCSASLPAERQGELPHRYMLGLYEVLERLTAKYPRVLFEGCASGGGRFDLGMLRYFPQIWTSDDTDPAARLKIQYGTSFFYPLSSVSAHISAAPCQQNGHVTPIDMRGGAALCGSFGLELDPAHMSADEKAAAKRWVELYKRFEGLMREGLYYRLVSPYDGYGCSAWQYTAVDGSESLVIVVTDTPQTNAPDIRLRLNGLRKDAAYRFDFGHIPSFTAFIPAEEYTGAALMEAGVSVTRPYGHEPAAVLHFTAV